MAARSAIFEDLALTNSTGLPSTKIKAFIYGCAWKRDQTSSLVHQALKAGFRGIDVAAQPRHYREELAGEGIRKFASEARIKREDVFIQTKYTSPNGQDPSNMPYDARLPIAQQVKASIASSLHNLRWDDSPNESYIDSLVLHSPLPTMEQTLEAWRACEAFVPTHIKHLGISNTDLDVLKALYEAATIKPSVVQNRFYPDTGFDVDIRAFCREHGIVYQSFWTLSANPKLIRSRPVQLVSASAIVQPQVALYALVLGLQGTVICNGTKTHMVEDLEGLKSVREWAESNEQGWADLVKLFRAAISDGSTE